VECPCKTEQTVVLYGMFFLVGGSSRAAVSLMQTQLGERKIVNGGSLGELSANEPKQQRLHDQRVDRCCANQPSPEAQSRTRSISRGSHAHESYVEGVLNALTRFADDSDWRGFDSDGTEREVSITGRMAVATPMACCQPAAKNSIGRE